MHKAMSGLAERTLGAAVKRATPCYVLSGERRLVTITQPHILNTQIKMAVRRSRWGGVLLAGGACKVIDLQITQRTRKRAEDWKKHFLII